MRNHKLKIMISLLLVMLLTLGMLPTGFAAGTTKTPGGDDAAIANSVFFIALQTTDGGDVSYYYYSKAELEAIADTHALTYTDHSVVKTVTCKGALLETLLAHLDVSVSDNLIIQYAEMDGYHAQASQSIDVANAKDKVSWLTESHESGGTPVNAKHTMIAYGINEQYAKPDANNVNDPAGVYKDADNGTGCLRAYRDEVDANYAVLKTLIGVVISPSGSLLPGTAGYTQTVYSTKNKDTKLIGDTLVKGLVPGMKYAAKAPPVTNATVHGAAYQMINPVAAGTSTNITFNYDESPYLSINNKGTTTNYVFSDFIKDGVQAPSAADLAAKGIDSSKVYGYSGPMFYRYNGIWLSDLVKNIGTKVTVTLTAKDGSKKTIDPANVGNYFIAFKNTQSKTSTNTPESKRVTVSYENPKVIIPKDGVLTYDGSSDTGKDVTVFVASLKSVTVSDITVSAIKLNKSAIDLAMGKTFALTAAVSPSNAVNTTVKWTTSNAKVATVSATGVVTATGKGTATVKCTAADGSGVNASCKVTVQNRIIALNKTSAKLISGKTLKLSAIVTKGKGAPVTTVLLWKSSNSKIAKVNSKGTVTLLKGGKVTITCYAKDDHKILATCSITVLQAVKDIKLSASSKTVKVGKTVKIKASLTPSNASDKTVAWKTSDSKIATIDAKGVVTGIKAGTVTITCTAKDGSGVKETIKIKVK